MVKKFKTLSKSRSITIPKDIAARLDLSEGTAVDLTAADGKLIITKHAETCLFCDTAENVKQFEDVFVCRFCAARMYEEVSK